MVKIVAIGEPMIELNAMTVGKLRDVTYFEKHVAGAELNFCIAAKVNGVDCSLIAKVGDDEFGYNVIEYARGKGVDTSMVKVDPKLPTAVFFIQRGYPVPMRSISFYYRKGSAGSSLSPSDIDVSKIREADLVHTTGITLAISDSAKEAAMEGLRNSRKSSLDTNIRLKLWSPEKARETLLKVIPEVDILVTDPDDARIIGNVSEPDEAFSFFSKMGVSTLVYKTGIEGTYVYHEGEKFVQRGYHVQVEDPTGAGDSLSGTFISLLLKRKSVDYALSHAVASATLVVTTRGDNEIIPDEESAEKFLKEFK
ncbi:bifunctional 2-dehydro-3-deoxygluconokinase/2-dehydro-3-deoxygalactonokinase [Sulfuracidifex tepidarius]|uniref:2-dehydro-3-deoxygluconokinase n=1 Tax=Sulfuracidifex tepidarius TaxID=1294262 RepID=A0A510DX39_9CREN|nr:bifunctional 2-dehydro-3-deoxygluconokinase/2-dehydro-3-deoxygalactonokinase [Sulfuracidifex tepidarius]BBG24796.1 2-dehydro-3-deoxygluconokinase [Sulfuracidifex tepidarius]BBG27582.1 2-dehydro-3-deoxygluconokinase/2-dehydro-3-deoxygalactonokinase [Sulfuracidifex tepidarius]